jgi:hypothetical protein
MKNLIRQHRQEPYIAKYSIPAVVSLLAMTNNVTVAAYATAANSWYLFQVKRGLLT